MSGIDRTTDHRIGIVSIRPGVSILSLLRYLNYRPWFALAEFVDNAIQSYRSRQPDLEGLHGERFKLQVNIDIDHIQPSRISITDNAAGIAHQEFPRAFRPAEIPEDRSGLSEFGMGMKSAACWFAPKWSVRTTSIGEPIERTVRFDIDRIVHDEIDELKIDEVPINLDTHYTEVVLDELHHVPRGRTVAKIKDHLMDIYRVFIRDGTLALRYNGELITYTEPSILHAPSTDDPDGLVKVWRKTIDFDFGEGLSAKGFAALRDPGSFSASGFSLFRRSRLIQGSADEGYRPPAIFQNSNSFRSLRLFGELHLEGFEVSHTKDGFRWDENEEPFLELLGECLNDGEIPLLSQADKYRARASGGERRRAAEQAVDNIISLMRKTLVDVMRSVAEKMPVETREDTLPVAPQLAIREVPIRFRDQIWLVRVELTDDPAEGEWLSVSAQKPNNEGEPRLMEIRLSMAHPFMIRFAQTEPEQIEALLRVAAGLALSETLARRSGVRYAGTVRRNLNDILREALAQP